MKEVLTRIFLLFVSLVIGANLTAQFILEQEKEVGDSLQISQAEEFLSVIENTLQNYYRDFFSSEKEIDSIIEFYGHEKESVPDFSDSIYIARLIEMSKNTPYHFDYNADVLANIRFFSQKRRDFVRVVLGRSKLYFNMFEEKLIKHDLPLELKYLAVIESGLRPNALSRAGALGLWQFMYRTGKAFGLMENSYIDERMDPELATEAACMYLKHLYNLYEDWNMVLAAYNAGPGNVNKAIRRSGGKMTYWEIRPFLPKETQKYVPNYITMSYLMTYHAEHNILPKEAKIHDFETDTVCLKSSLHMRTIDSLIAWSANEIKELNPKFKLDYIPQTSTKQCLNIPIYNVEKWISFEDSLYVLEAALYSNKPDIKVFKMEPTIAKNTANTTVHSVKSGQTLGHIAVQYGTTVKNIMRLNNLHSTRLSIGQKLIVNGNANATSVTQKATNTVPKSTDNSLAASGGKSMHTINQGDNLWIIARKNGTTVDELKRLNPNINHMDLKVGQKIRIR